MPPVSPNPKRVAGIAPASVTRPFSQLEPDRFRASPDGQWLAVKELIWDRPTGASPIYVASRSEGTSRKVTDVAIDCWFIGNDRLALWTPDDRIEVVDLARDRLVNQFAVSKVNTIAGVHGSRSGRLLAVSHESVITIHDCTTGESSSIDIRRHFDEEAQEWYGFHHWLWSMAFDPNEERLWCVCSGILFCVDLTSGDVIHRLPSPSRDSDVPLFTLGSRRERSLLAAQLAPGGPITIFDAETLEVQTETPTIRFITQLLTLSPYADTVYVAGTSDSATVLKGFDLSSPSSSRSYSVPDQRFPGHLFATEKSLYLFLTSGEMCRWDADEDE